RYLTHLASFPTRRSSDLRHRDFRLLWYGAFVSFVGSWIQKQGEGWLVNYMTHDVAKLTFVSFCANAPVAFLGPFAGALADAFDKDRKSTRLNSSHEWISY